MEFWRILVESFARLLLRLHFDCDCDGPDAKNVQHNQKVGDCERSRTRDGLHGGWSWMKFWQILVESESFARQLLRLHFDCDCDSPDTRTCKTPRKVL